VDHTSAPSSAINTYHSTVCFAITKSVGAQKMISGFDFWTNTAKSKDATQPSIQLGGDSMIGLGCQLTNL